MEQSDLQIYKDYYLKLQKDWLSKDKELYLVGKLSYWCFWLSKHAEVTTDKEQKKKLFKVKTKIITLLSRSKYIKIKKYIPPITSKLCRKHIHFMIKDKVSLHNYLFQRKKQILKCEKCKSGEENYYILYSIALLNHYDPEQDRKPYFIFYSPYNLLKDILPPLENLDEVKFFKGEYGLVQENRLIDLSEGFSLSLITKKVKESYNEYKVFLNK